MILLRWERHSCLYFISDFFLSLNICVQIYIFNNKKKQIVCVFLLFGGVSSLARSRNSHSMFQRRRLCVVCVKNVHTHRHKYRCMKQRLIIRMILCLLLLFVHVVAVCNTVGRVVVFVIRQFSMSAISFYLILNLVCVCVLLLLRYDDGQRSERDQFSLSLVALSTSVCVCVCSNSHP